MRLAEDAIKLGKVLPLLLVFAVSLREALPSGQFFDSVAKKLEFIIARCRWFARVPDTAPQSVLEIIEAEKSPVDKTAVESPLYQDLQFMNPKHSDGALPAGPDEAEPLRSQFVEGVAEKARGEISIELAAQRNHGESFAHAGADELLGIGIENNVEEGLRVAVKDRGHDTVAGRSGRVTENCVGFVIRAPQ